MRVIGIICLFLLITANATWAEDFRFPFADSAQEQQFDAIVKELRCLVCQNQSLEDSDAPLAHDLREQVFEMLKDGATEQDIIDFMVSRYGEFVLYRPRVTPATALLWLAPLLFLLAGIVIIVSFVKRRNRQTEGSVPRDKLEQARRLLDED